MSSPMIRGMGKVAATVATAGIVLFVSVGGVLAGGNNGTLKVHELGTPVGTENNDPKVCAFNLEAFGLDAGQGGYLALRGPGRRRPARHGPGRHVRHAAGQCVGVLDLGRRLQRHGGGTFISNGHYKVTLYGKSTPTGQLSDVKAKSKVFKVTCSGIEE